MGPNGVSISFWGPGLLGTESPPTLLATYLHTLVNIMKVAEDRISLVRVCEW